MSLSHLRYILPTHILPTHILPMHVLMKNPLIQSKSTNRCFQLLNLNLHVFYQIICSYVFMPFAFIMGVSWDDCFTVAELLGIKTFVNEFAAYEQLSRLIKNRRQMLAGTKLSVCFHNFYLYFFTSFIFSSMNNFYRAMSFVFFKFCQKIHHHQNYQEILFLDEQFL